jgi:hypothetical protein
VSGGQIVITAQATELVIGADGASTLAVEQPLAAMIAVVEQGPPGPPGPPGTGGGGGGSLTLSTQTEDFTVAAADLATRILADRAGALIATLPNSLPAGFNCSVAQEGAGSVFFVAGTGASIQSPLGADVKVSARYGAAFLLVKDNAGGTAADWRIRGDIAAGVPPEDYGPLVQQFFDRLSVQPTAERAALYAALIGGLAADGVWDKLDALYVFAAADSATALTNLKQSSYGATAGEIDLPAFDVDLGFTGEADKYIDTNFDPNSATSPNYALDSASFFAWQLTNVSVTAGHGDLAASFGASRLLLDPREGNTFYAGINTNSTPFAVNTDSRGLFVISRTASNVQKGYKGASEVLSGTATADAVPSTNLAFLRWVSRDYVGCQVAAGGFGAGLSGADVTALHGRLLTYLQGVGAES